MGSEPQEKQGSRSQNLISSRSVWTWFITNFQLPWQLKAHLTPAYMGQKQRNLMGCITNFLHYRGYFLLIEGGANDQLKYRCE